MGEQPLPSGCRQELGTSAPGLYPALHYPIAIRETAGSMEKHQTQPARIYGVRQTNIITGFWLTYGREFYGLFKRA